MGEFFILAKIIFGDETHILGVYCEEDYALCDYDVWLSKTISTQLEKEFKQFKSKSLSPEGSFFFGRDKTGEVFQYSDGYAYTKEFEDRILQGTSKEEEETLKQFYPIFSKMPVLELQEISLDKVLDVDLGLFS